MWLNEAPSETEHTAAQDTAAELISDAETGAGGCYVKFKATLSVSCASVRKVVSRILVENLLKFQRKRIY